MEDYYQNTLHDVYPGGESKSNWRVVQTRKKKRRNSTHGMSVNDNYHGIFANNCHEIVPYKTNSF
jgi:hypothetical protein